MNQQAFTTTLFVNRLKDDDRVVVRFIASHQDYTREIEEIVPQQEAEYIIAAVRLYSDTTVKVEL